jgi:hypothetical protein
MLADPRLVNEHEKFTQRGGEANTLYVQAPPQQPVFDVPVCSSTNIHKFDHLPNHLVSESGSG